MKFVDLKLETNNEVSTIENGENKIEVKRYLPVSDKYDLIMTTLQQSLEPNGLYNELKMETYLHLNIIFLYTDLEFTDEERENSNDLYDKLESNGIINAVINEIQGEYKILMDYLRLNEQKLTARNLSVAGAFSELVNSLPLNAAAAKEILESFDPSKYQEVLNFAEGIGMKVNK